MVYICCQKLFEYYFAPNRLPSGASMTDIAPTIMRGFRIESGNRFGCQIMTSIFVDGFLKQTLTWFMMAPTKVFPRNLKQGLNMDAIERAHLERLRRIGFGLPD